MGNKVTFKYACDCCLKPNLVQKPGFACPVCEFEMDLAEQEFEAKLASQPKRQCRDCDSPLPADRYFICCKCTNYRDLAINSEASA